MLKSHILDAFEDFIKPLKNEVRFLLKDSENPKSIPSIVFI